MSHPFGNHSNDLIKWGTGTNNNPDDWTDAVITSSLKLVSSLRDQRTNNSIPKRSISFREPDINRRAPRCRQVPRDNALATAESLETWLKCGLAIGAGALAITAFVTNALHEDNRNNHNNERD